MPQPQTPKLNLLLRALVEIAGIMFLFYSNLLMGEFDRTNGAGKTLRVALQNVVTRQNVEIALITSTCGFVIFELLRTWLARREREN